MSLKDHCHCDHAKESHHKGQFACNAAYCECRKYVLYMDPYEEDPTPTERIMPAAPAVMDPYDGCADTWPMFPAVSPWDPP
jgi:hypothetical protein